MSGGAPDSTTGGGAVLTLADIDRPALGRLLARYGIRLELLPVQATIPGSYWGDSEAGLQGNRLFARPDTPVHSILHEGSHYICMDPGRRAGLDRDAGGGDLEESAVCYLQVLLARELADVGDARLMRDMDAWGYSFRLGDTRSWFEADALDAREWLLDHQVLDEFHRLTGDSRA